MGIFGKSKKQKAKEEEERLEAEEEEQKEKDLARPKRIKDLNSENSKRRKAPPKPWTKRERFLILGVLGFTVITAGILAGSARAWKLPGLPRITAPSFNFEDTITVDNPKRKDAKFDTLDRELSQLTLDLSGIYSVYVYDLKTKEEFGFQDTEVMQAASLIKLPVMGLMYSQAEKGTLALTTRYTLRDEDKVAGSGSLYGRPAGTVFTYRQLAEFMGQQSDNTSFNVMRQVLTDTAVDNFAKQVGMINTSTDENQTTARDVGIFFRKLWNEQIVEEEYKDEILDYLTNTIYEDWIPATLPEGTEVAHKYGREVHVINDAGIVMGNNPYVLVVMTDGIVEKEAGTAIPEIVKLVHSKITASSR